ncbi:hypothetical protein SAMN05421636_103355 [Pricia antarctica]|uniref:Uncharacterized protein n=1 Tax=Pricia antarctica TaxID=641691 RepID=A0A1G7AHG4_9FLAO|nr:hypothetical protein [Pricia antarctica]SDE13495.1 hypothetical protein SAMN05421636_103355 [Pricia antarctica]
MKKSVIIVIGITFYLFPEVMEAQCAMCRAVLESNGNTSTAEGINNGIVYLMAIPYIAIAILGYFVYKKMKPKTAQEV